MDFDAIRRVACWKPPAKKPESKAIEPSKPPPPAPPANPTPTPNPAPQPPGALHGPGVPPHMGHYMREFEDVRGDPRFGWMEHSKTWKLGFHPNYSDNYSYQDCQGHAPVPQDYYRSSYGNPGMNSRDNYREIGYYPDHSMITNKYLDDTHCNCQSQPGYITTSGGRRGISAPPQRLALPPPDRYMDDYYDHDHHHGYGQLSRGRYPGGNRRSPGVREFGPGAYGPPALPGPPPYDHHHCPRGPSRGVAQYYLPSTYDNCFSDENPNACSVM